jgi:hypothetical protein
MQSNLKLLEAMPNSMFATVNCDSFFGDRQVTGPTGATLTLPGICRSIRSFMQNHGIITDEYTLQWDSQRQRRETRQGQACSVSGLSYCNGDNALKQMQLFGTNTGVPDVTNCDEFPFAASMQGGSTFLGLNPVTPLGVTRTCVARYQNNMQGMCNRK